MGKNRILGNPSALEKLSFVEPSVLKQQGTTRDIYHYLKYNENLASYEFFTDLNNTKALFKNIDTNKLTHGEALVVKRINFKRMITGDIDDERVLDLTPLQFNAMLNVLAGKLDLVVGNQTIIKDLSLIKAMSFTKAHSSDNGSFIDLESEIVIPYNTEFKVILKQVPNGQAAPGFLGIHLEGYGKILSLDRTI